MKRFAALLTIICLPLALASCGVRRSASETQDLIIGKWDGLGRMSGTKARLIFNPDGTLEYNPAGGFRLDRQQQDGEPEQPLHYEFLGAHHLRIYQDPNSPPHSLWKTDLPRPKSSHGYLRAFPVADTIYNVYLNGDNLSVVDPWSDEARRFKRQQIGPSKQQTSSVKTRAHRIHEFNFGLQEK